MSRPLHPDFAAALSDSTVYPVLFFEGEFATGMVNLWTGLGELVWDGKTWTGGGVLLGVSPMDEVSGVVASGATVSLSGIPNDIMQVVLNEARQGKAGKSWFGLLTEGGDVIADPAQMFIGRLDVPRIQIDRDSVTVSISYENRLIDMDRSIGLRYTDQGQRSLYPDDAGFEYVSGLQDFQIEGVMV